MSPHTANWLRRDISPFIQVSKFVSIFSKEALISFTPTRTLTFLLSILTSKLSVAAKLHHQQRMTQSTVLVDAQAITNLRQRIAHK